MSDLDLEAIEARANAAAEYGMPEADDALALVAEVKRLRGHSIDLNSVGWALAEALGRVPEGADRIHGEPVEQAAAIIAERDEAHAIIAALAGHCTTPGCPGDVRYSAPGRGHLADCAYPATAEVSA